MAKFKVNFFFSLRKGGWSETWYTDQADNTAAFNRALVLVRARAKLLGTPATIDAIRVSATDGSRQSTLAAIGPSTPYPYTPEIYSANADIGSTAAYCLAFSSAPFVQRPVYLRGNPDSLFQEGPVDVADANIWFSNFTGAFRTEVQSGAWFIATKPRLHSDANELDINSVANVPNTLNMTVTLSDVTLAFQPNDLMQIYKLKGANPAPNLVRVLRVGPTADIVQVRYSLPANFVYQGGAIARKYLLQFGAINEIDFQRFTSHKVGRPFGASRGRARSRPR